VLHEERDESLLSVKKKKAGNLLLTYDLRLSWKLLIALMIEAVTTPEKLGNLYRPSRRYNPEDSHLRNLLRSCVSQDWLCSIELVNVSFQ
jgi:hypothetical protein